MKIIFLTKTNYTMKQVSTLLILFLSVSVVLGQQRQVFEKELPDAELDQYESYAFGDGLSSVMNQEYVTENTLLNNMVENAIAYEFDVYDYELDADNADLLVNFMVFDQKYSDEVGYMPGYRIDEDFGMDDNVLEQLKDGSLMVSMVSTEDGQTVWSGYVPDGIDTSASLREQQKDARQAVSAAMEMFMADVNFEDTPSTSLDDDIGAN